MSEDNLPGSMFGSLEWLMFEGAPPPPPHLVQWAEDLVGRARLRLKNFRVDLEAIQSTAMDAGTEGEIAMADAQMLFLDHGELVSRPLVRRYIEACEAELVARWLMSRGGFHFTDWATPRNLAALDGMVALGEQALAVRVVRKHLEKTQARAKQKWLMVGRKRPANMSADIAERYDEAVAKAAYELPGEIDAARMEIAELEHYVRAHGSHEDNRAVDAMIGELEKARKRFNIA